MQKTNLNKKEMLDRIGRRFGKTLVTIGGLLFMGIVSLTACGNTSADSTDKNNMKGEENVTDAGSSAKGATFDADSAYKYVAQQVEFGPRVPNTEAHRKAGDWLAAELKRHGAKVTEQRMQLTAFDGTRLDSRNIFGQYNPESPDRLLLLAHWDCRPWADEDPDPARRKLPVDGANDGASGVGVLLEIARQLGMDTPKKGVDILFVDAEDWGNEGDEDSWALGTKYFAENLPIEGYAPLGAILLDMVGAKGATFHREYFSEKSAPWLSEAVWKAARRLGYDDMFPNRMGSAVTDDHVQLIAHGIPAIDIIDYRAGSGFDPNWHTGNDTLEGIDPATLAAVGHTLISILRE